MYSKSLLTLSELHVTRNDLNSLDVSQTSKSHARGRQFYATKLKLKEVAFKVNVKVKYDHLHSTYIAKYDTLPRKIALTCDH